MDKIKPLLYQWLARRDYSQQELVKKLSKKGFAPADIHPIIKELAQAGLINESRFAENYIHWRQAKGVGPLRIALELQARGIPEEMIAEHLQITDNAWFIEARRAWQKQFKGKQAISFTEKAKQMRFLQYRGFTQEQITKTVCFNILDNE